MPTREVVDAFCSYATVIVPLFVPLEPEVINSHVAPPTTEALQVIVPPPVFDTLKVVVPEALLTSRFDGVTDNTDVEVAPAWVTLTLTGLPVAPAAVT